MEMLLENHCFVMYYCVEIANWNISNFYFCEEKIKRRKRNAYPRTQFLTGMYIEKKAKGWQRGQNGLRTGRTPTDR